MQLVKTYSHGNLDTYIYQVAFAGKDWLVMGGQDGNARIYDQGTGAFIQKLVHSPEGKLTQ